MFNIESCINCSSNDFKHVMEVNDFSITKEDFNLSQCSNCGFLFTQDAPSESEIARYYKSEDYISHSDTNKGLINKIYHIVRKIMLSKKYKLINRLPGDKNILDIGSGTGYFLNFMKQKGYDTMGIEVDENARSYGKEKFQLNILPPEDFINGSIDRKFSFISMWHVLEHISDPNKYMQIIHNLLTNDGYVIIALPNNSSYDAAHYKNYWAGYDVPRHLWHFTPDTLEQFAQKSGFKLVKMHRLPFDAFYVSLLSEKYKGSALGLIKGGMIGFISMLKSWINVRNTSSVIYVLQKK